MNVIWIVKPHDEATHRVSMPGWLIYLGSLSVVIGVCVGAWLAH
jgi:hypothetical protein